MKKLFFSLFFLIFSLHPAFTQQKGLNAKFIAANYYKGIVKILLYDSAAAKQDPSRGYVGRGSGFVVTDDGIVFTNRHVVELCVNGYMDYDYNDAATNSSWRTTAAYSEEKIKDASITKIHYTGYATPIVQVYFGKGEHDYKLYAAKVLTIGIGSFDGAMLKIISDLNGNPVSTKFFTLPVGNSDNAVQGEDLCVFGFPAQYDGGFDLMLNDMSTLTFGKLSGYDYVFNKDYGYIKTDASINSGNSGGPVFDESNRVVGIATATSAKTNIGLVGGINGMYYVVAPKSEVLQHLTAKGLTIPKNAGSINTILGERKDILPAEELNKTKSSSGKISDGSSSNVVSEYYKNSKITFHNSLGDNGVLGKAGDLYDILGDGLDFVYVQVNNYGEPLNSDGFVVEAYKKSGEAYVFVETKNFDVQSDKSAAYFKYFPPSTGDYRLSVYTKNSSFINDGYVTFKLKDSGSSENTSGSGYYAKSKINFTNDEANVLKPDFYYKDFSIGKEGGFVYLVLDNYPDALNTGEIIVDIWKKKGSKYDSFVETKRYSITNTSLDYTYFKYTFYETGEYKFSVFTKDQTWINTGYVIIKKK
ncbi:MAG: trypsin-like peptidase domain-containing protein [Bacteroidetes bacterium]|nr:trypsin-like peptidase domain-containing protein [Bacteroidota bacterium]